jgi:hypothetical protein
MDWYDNPNPAFVERMVEQWQWYAPNMTKDNIVAWNDTTPADMQRKLIDMAEVVGHTLTCIMTRWEAKPLTEYSR